MNNRQRFQAIYHYQDVDRIPVVIFGFWRETLQKWVQEGHITRQEADECYRNNTYRAVGTLKSRLGIDWDFETRYWSETFLFPYFEEKELYREKDGSRIVQNHLGHIVRQKEGLVSIPSDVGTILTDRKVWETFFLPKLQFTPDRIYTDWLRSIKEEEPHEQEPMSLYVGSLMGNIRDIFGVEAMSYFIVDEEDLFREIVDTFGELIYKVVKEVLSFGIPFDMAHFWEDICFKNGPLLNPKMVEELFAPHYARITTLLKEHGIDIVTLDSDGCIDLLVSIWLRNGVNTMFPIEVGTWGGSIEPWRKQYGKELRGLGGMDKRVFAQDKQAVDREVERLRRLIDLGGFIPCVDHLIAPDAKFELVQYYCDKMHHIK